MGAPRSSSRRTWAVHHSIGEDPNSWWRARRAARKSTGRPCGIVAVDRTRFVAGRPCRPDHLAHASLHYMSNPRSAPELSSVDTARWEEARRRLPIVRQLIECPNRTRAEVITAATTLGLGVTQTYELLR